MILKSLEDLERYKDDIINVNSFVNMKEINEVSNVGGDSTNSFNNKLFYWNFEPCHIQDLVDVFNRITEAKLRTKNLRDVEEEIKFIAKDMIDEQTCPIESILYTSKMINEYMYKYPYLIDFLGKIICDIYNEKKDEYKDTIKFILKEWSWNNQLIILINACGKIGDIELLEAIRDDYSKENYRLELLKSFMNIKTNICNEYALELISKTSERDGVEVQMAKYFIKNYYNCYGDNGIKNADKYLSNNNLNKQSKKIISRAIPNISNVESVTLNTMIKKAKNWNIEPDFEETFEKWMIDPATRKNAMLAVRYSNSQNIEKMIMEILNNYKCNSVEIGTAMITLAQWGSRKVLSQDILDLIKDNQEDITRKVYCNAAMCSIGKEYETKELIKDFLEEEYYDNKQIFSIIRDCAYKSNQLLRRCIKDVYTQYLNSEDEQKQIKAINAAYELCNKPKFNFKDIVLPLIKERLGIKTTQNSVDKKNISTNQCLAILGLVEKLLNDNNKNEFIDILFFMIEDERCSANLRLKATSMLKQLRIDPPK